MNHVTGSWRFWKKPEEPSVILYPTTMTRVTEDPQQWRAFKSDAHFPVSFKLAPPQVRELQQQTEDLTLAAVVANQLGDGAASPVAEAPPKVAQPQPPPPTSKGHRDLATEPHPAKRRSVRSPSPSRAPGASGSEPTKPIKPKPPSPRSDNPAKPAPPQQPAGQEAPARLAATKPLPLPPQPMMAPVLPPPPLPRTPKREAEPMQSQQSSPRPSPGTSSSAEVAAGPSGPPVVEPRPPVEGWVAPTSVEIAATDSTIRAHGIR